MSPRADPALVDAVRVRRLHRFRHDLAGDPRLDPARVPQLVAQASPREVFHHLGALPELLPRGDAPMLDLPAEQVAREIPGNGCWLRVGRIEQVGEWSGLLGDCLDGLDPAGDQQAQLFFASPASVTPAHFDTYHNLLHQVHGTKDLSIGVFADPAEARREIANRFRRRENLRVLPSEVTVFHMEPGDALYIPPYTFHWARTGDDLSVALSCTFENDWSERARLVEACNARLRQLGITAAPPGTSDTRDAVKAGVVRTWRAARTRLGR